MDEFRTAIRAMVAELDKEEQNEKRNAFAEKMKTSIKKGTGYAFRLIKVV